MRARVKFSRPQTDYIPPSLSSNVILAVIISWMKWKLHVRDILSSFFIKNSPIKLGCLIVILFRLKEGQKEVEELALVWELLGSSQVGTFNILSKYSYTSLTIVMSWKEGKKYVYTCSTFTCTGDLFPDMWASITKACQKQVLTSSARHYSTSFQTEVATRDATG